MSLDITNVTHLSHGFDPFAHRPVKVSASSENLYDVSFIGTWSPHKEEVIAFLVRKLTNIRIQILGNQWHRATSSSLQGVISAHEIIIDY